MNPNTITPSGATDSWLEEYRVDMANRGTPIMDGDTVAVCDDDWCVQYEYNNPNAWSNVDSHANQTSSGSGGSYGGSPPPQTPGLPGGSCYGAGCGTVTVGEIKMK